MSKLAVAVIHYHLRPGGVTRVIERAVESLGNNVDLLVLTGEAPAPNDALTPLTEPFQPLAYSEATTSNPEKLVEDLRVTARSLLGRDPDLWHIHNHALGKNDFTPQLVKHLAKAGCRLLLQPHDFAEDGRPKNYQLLNEHPLYPIADHVWYAPINHRDKTFLQSIGLPHVHELPNAVTKNKEKACPPAPAGNTRTILYPARAIRRKNIGEFLLWSLLAPNEYRFQSTLAPQNPVWQGIYTEWVNFAKELNLPVEFDAGRNHDFDELVQKAEALITTSIAEGFGLAFLEPWLEGKMLLGRKLPEITTDFEQEGLDLSGLYATLPVPIEWVGKTQFFVALETAMKASYATYSKPWNPIYLDQAKAALLIDGKVDFGLLDETLQRKVIRHLAENPQDRTLLPPFTLHSAHLIRHNKKMVTDHYSLKSYGERLLKLYQELAATKTTGPVSFANATDLLNQFLQPKRFNLLRT